MSDTIYALATAAGKSGVSIIRLSGPASIAVLTALGGPVPEPRKAQLYFLRDQAGEILDQAVVLRFAEKASFTGEEIVEFQCHGSMAVVKAIFSAIEETGLARLAEPGEFTRRALLNDRMDLTQVQGLADLIDADTEVQRRHAMRVFDGELTQVVESWRRDLIRARALLEATIDFADEDVPQDVLPEVSELILSVITSLEAQLSGVGSAERIRDGFDIAIVGAPNVGKSSLLNALTKSDAAIVSEIPGTTRDLIEVRLDVGGFQINLIDTAGLRDTNDVVERIGVERARDRAARADLRIFLYEDSKPVPEDVTYVAGDIKLRTKSDISGHTDGISTVTGQGVSELLLDISHRLSKISREAGLVSRSRDQQAISWALGLLKEVLHALTSTEVELLASDIGAATEYLNRIVGRVDVETILGEIFSSFCLGK
ncbi:tRNA uridine-5-carboxymethylaminomethyl(34) synthesis GTPase MnmE [uncultured Jannaschia sp.]|uniref:tRNA uridine-5-carboxymethylaminomethyl(34) synthesis GTPase MnmE n=1 Tax=uncultured Jannaschia sp. TaxID=293347 RepID=UPI00262420AD|nr:tRNA uridine-5-carboxymethylaminomethyl(34) synthesis GTPase MnmE [uncultured Jannaschia sp.]